MSCTCKYMHGFLVRVCAKHRHKKKTIFVRYREVCRELHNTVLEQMAVRFNEDAIKRNNNGRTWY